MMWGWWFALYRVGINFNIRCFEIDNQHRCNTVQPEINFNIRCFEMQIHIWLCSLSADKLQHKMFWNSGRFASLDNRSTINFNIRCFEIYLSRYPIQKHHKINFNIRCFEMHPVLLFERLLADKLQHKMFWNDGEASQTGTVRR